MGAFVDSLYAGSERRETGAQVPHATHEFVFLGSQIFCVDEIINYEFNVVYASISLSGHRRTC
jgi:hypothetical protein